MCHLSISSSIPEELPMALPVQVMVMEEMSTLWSCTRTWWIKRREEGKDRDQMGPSCHRREAALVLSAPEPRSFL